MRGQQLCSLLAVGSLLAAVAGIGLAIKFHNDGLRKEREGAKPRLNFVSSDTMSQEGTHVIVHNVIEVCEASSLNTWCL